MSQSGTGKFFLKGYEETPMSVLSAKETALGTHFTVSLNQEKRTCPSVY